MQYIEDNSTVLSNDRNTNISPSIYVVENFVMKEVYTWIKYKKEDLRYLKTSYRFLVKQPFRGFSGCFKEPEHKGRKVVEPLTVLRIPKTSNGSD
jgi:hypothetical protein